MKIKLFLLLGVFALITGCQNDDDGADNAKPRKDIALSRAEEVLADGNLDFAFRLFQQVNATETQQANWIISPLSASLALGMTANGAAGNTLEEIKNTLGFGTFELAAMNSYNQKLIKELLDLDNTTRLNIANSVWLNNSLPVNDSFVEVNKDMYDAPVSSVDLNSSKSIELINNWAAQQTNNAIKNVISQVPSGAMFYMLNALYFKGIWKKQFKTTATKEEIFTNADRSSARIPMMNQQETFNYIYNDNFCIAEFPYGNEAFSMVVLLPTDEKGLENALGKLTAENWKVWYEQRYEQKLNVKLPRFEINYKKDLIGDMQAMGIKDAFNSATADFTSMSSGGDLYLNILDQFNYIKVNEEGTEAASVTNSGGGLTANPKIPEPFYVNRPFAFMIKEKSTGTILFMGKVTKM